MTLMFCFNSPQNDEEKMQTIMISVKTPYHISIILLNLLMMLFCGCFDKYLEMMDPAKNSYFNLM